MFDLIDNLFNVHKYISQEVAGGKFYSLSPSGTKTAFWLTIQVVDLNGLLGKQAELFNECKQICSNDAFGKNVSMLILWDTGGKLDFGVMKQKIIEIEEDTYFFKKYVLYYSSLEYEDLRKQLGENAFTDFFNTQIVLPETFAYYKQNSEKQNWQSLLYRIMIKIPFTDIDIRVAKGLELLSETNTRNLQKANLFDINTVIFENFNDIPLNSDIKPSQLLDKIKPALGGQTDGN